MTTCIPTKPFRCWQYWSESKWPVPEWAVKHYQHYHGTKDYYSLRDGDWIVDLPTGPTWFAACEFKERFAVTS
jgi:hypothetical protein